MINELSSGVNIYHEEVCRRNQSGHTKLDSTDLSEVLNLKSFHLMNQTINC